MIRMVLFTVAGLAFAGSVAWAQSPPPEGSDSRYTFHRVDDGYVRLDGRTGQVSMCVQRPIGWACQAVPDERAALEAEIERLQGESAALKKELIARNLPLPGAARPEPPPRLQLPNDADLDKVVTFFEKIWRRFVEVIVTLQKDLQNKT
jgi:hypothetical protein